MKVVSIALFLLALAHGGCSAGKPLNRDHELNVEFKDATSNKKKMQAMGIPPNSLHLSIEEDAKLLVVRSGNNI